MAETVNADLLIIGAGPTGLFGAYYAGFRGLDVAVMDSLPEPGGQVTAMYPEKVIFDVAGFPAVKGQELVDALRYHTLGHERFGRLGCALFAADFLEPGRDIKQKWRRGLRGRMPAELESVTREILQARVIYLVKEGRPVRPETMGFWNSMAGGDPWARASEV